MAKRLGFLLLFALLLSCQKEGEEAGGDRPPGGAERAVSGQEVKDRLGVGRIFPHLAVRDQVGKHYDLYNLLTKPYNLVLVIDAFCPACGEEGQTIQKFAQGSSKVNLIGVSKDSLPAILAFKKYHGLFFPVLRDFEEKLVPDYRRVSFPTLVLAGPDRKIIRLYEGEIPPEEAGPFLRALLGL